MARLEIARDRVKASPVDGKQKRGVPVPSFVERKFGRIALKRPTTADPTVTWEGNVEAILECSRDGGETWELLVGFTAPGGVVMDPRTGREATESAAHVRLSEPLPPGCLFRWRIQGGNLDTEVVTEVE